MIGCQAELGKPDALYKVVKRLHLVSFVFPFTVSAIKSRACPERTFSDCTCSERSAYAYGSLSFLSDRKSVV